MTNNPTSTSESAAQRWRPLLAHVVIAAIVMAATIVVVRELFMPHTIAEASAPEIVLALLIGWQFVWFTLFTGLRLVSRRPLPVGTAIARAVLTVIGAVFPAVVLFLLLPWGWTVVVGTLVVTAAIAVRQIIRWPKRTPAADPDRGQDAADVS
ncbi:hypothetical protein GCM10011609_76820 [Lentzea pudingi]|uniref:Low temperature requirement A protein (LtrA) n=1 Tax=Lentzea pudingi TaxID=1789439 RepID=A0ABQ2INY1_9PSEU|nr:hypothetical protein [Lentzea pudingi]GGN23799.1 hypothetical protein GCM10011609_76820 [Lentzea pudingi]